MVDENKLKSWLDRFTDLKVLVIGDFFLDKYLILERALGETSLETGLEAYQVVDVRCSPGAAGTVTSNLRALGAQVIALGVIGDDGEGYELKRGLAERGIQDALLTPALPEGKLFTPTYTKPMMREPDGRTHELNRLDIKNRAPLPQAAENALIERLESLAPQVDAVVVADQVQERNVGAITDRVREAIIRLAGEYPQKVFAADSRERIGLYRNVIIKPNRREAARAVQPGWQGQDEQMSRAEVMRYGEALLKRTGKPVYLTMSAQGIMVFTAQGAFHSPVVPVTGEIDPVGAGDSTMAGIALALAAGANWEEAAIVGNIVASITIQQIGTTGTASPAQVLARFREIQKGGLA
jgi:rfaE bifunctional protein kinase chain/domain